MRLLFTTFTFAPQGNGVAEVVGAQAFGLARRGHEVTVATAHDPARNPSTSSANPRVVEFMISGAPRPAAEVRRYHDFIATFPADIILCHCWRSWPTDLAVPALPANQAKKILVSHGYAAHRWQPSKKFAWGVGQWLKAQPYVWRMPKILRAFDHLVVLSPRVDTNRFVDHWVARRLRGPSCSAIPNGTHPEQFEGTTLDFRKQFGISDEFLVLCVAAYVDAKNQAGVLRAFRRANLANAKLVFIGNECNDYTQQLRELDRRLPNRFGCGSVAFLEKIPREMIQAAYQASDLVVLASRRETQPLVLLDAMAAGKPFLSTNVGCVSDLPGGMVVKSERAMAAQMAALRGDPAWRLRLGQAGWAACRKVYNWPTVLDSYEALLGSLIRLS